MPDFILTHIYRTPVCCYGYMLSENLIEPQVKAMLQVSSDGLNYEILAVQHGRFGVKNTSVIFSCNVKQRLVARGTRALLQSTAPNHHDTETLLN